jgi:hypothetical protein
VNGGSFPRSEITQSLQFKKTWFLFSFVLFWHNNASFAAPMLQVIGAVGFMDHRLEIPRDVDLQWASMIQSCWDRYIPDFMLVLSNLFPFPWNDYPFLWAVTHNAALRSKNSLRGSESCKSSTTFRRRHSGKKLGKLLEVWASKIASFMSLKWWIMHAALGLIYPLELRRVPGCFPCCFQEGRPESWCMAS